MKKSRKSEKLERAVIDTNVVISGILSSKGAPSKIIEAWLQLLFTGLLSETLIAEIIDVLSRPKIKKIAGKKAVHFDAIIRALIERSEIVYPDKALDICDDPKDNMLFELAEKGKSNFIVTGDKIVLQVKKYKKTKVVTPTWFATNILN
ncbi:putative toxin-antitoxin system toxin component, PIN family [bacterium]|nr:putative toxin-antitoxin system toxin component, PIN family [bacterium]